MLKAKMRIGWSVSCLVVVGVACFNTQSDAMYYVHTAGANAAGAVEVTYSVGDGGEKTDVCKSLDNDKGQDWNEDDYNYTIRWLGESGGDVCGWKREKVMRWSKSKARTINFKLKGKPRAQINGSGNFEIEFTHGGQPVHIYYAKVDGVPLYMKLDGKGVEYEAAQELNSGRPTVVVKYTDAHGKHMEETVTCKHANKVPFETEDRYIDYKAYKGKANFFVSQHWLDKDEVVCFFKGRDDSKSSWTYILSGSISVNENSANGGKGKVLPKLKNVSYEETMAFIGVLANDNLGCRRRSQCFDDVDGVDGVDGDSKPDWLLEIESQFPLLTTYEPYNNNFHRLKENHKQYLVALCQQGELQYFETLFEGQNYKSRNAKKNKKKSPIKTRF